MSQLILSSTFHEPQFFLKDLIEKALPLIKKLFIDRVVCCTPSSDEEVIEFLISEGFKVPISKSMRQIDTYKLAYKCALDLVNENKEQKIFYIDFDRLIHWINTYPKELEETLKDVNVDYLHIGRTPPAFNTHPITQKKTEKIVNDVASKVLGFNNTRDIISVSHVITKELAIKIMEVENVTAMGFYCTWPIFFWNWADSKKYIEVRGQEWETPDRYKIEIENIGYEEWLKQFLTSSEWLKRVNLMNDCIYELLQLADLILKI